MPHRVRQAARALLVSLLFLVPGVSSALLIDFESLPGGVPAEGTPIGTQFVASAGVAFSLEDGGLPTLSQVGQPVTAFAPGDTPDDAARHGSFFLTDDGELDGLEMSPLIVSYSVPSAFVSGDLLDVDFDEAFRIEARGAGDVLLDAVVVCNNDGSASCATLGGETGSFATGDGVTTPWSIARSEADILSVRIVGERNRAGDFGLAFDNFDSGVVPEPGRGLLVGAGLALLAARTWKKTAVAAAGGGGGT